MSQQVLPQAENANENTPTPKWPLIGLISVLLLGTGTILFFIFAALFPAAEPDPYAGLSQPALAENGIGAISPPREVMDFTLTSHTGEPFTLSSLRGKAVVLYFGYTHCPDVCPLTLSELARAREQLGEQASDVQFLFITVDPERDTIEWMQKYLETRRADDFTTGLRGTEGDLKRIGADYGLFFEKNTETSTQAAYLVDHTASSFLIDPQGRLSAIMAFRTSPDVIANAIQAVLDET